MIRRLKHVSQPPQFLIPSLKRFLLNPSPSKSSPLHKWGANPCCRISECSVATTRGPAGLALAAAAQELREAVSQLEAAVQEEGGDLVVEVQEVLL
eukprot:372434-Prorocentrum_minimum.AAC.1